jgi:hypothetical protein
MKFKNAGKQELVLNTQNPIIQNMIISTLREADVNVCENTIEFDSDYPTLVWDGKQITQSMMCSPTDYTEEQNVLLLGVEEFMDKFVKPEPKLMPVGNYEAVITAEIAEVGCQRIPYDIVKAVYECMTEMRN